MYFPKRKRTPYTYKKHLEIILYHIKRARQEICRKKWMHGKSTS